MAHIKGVYWWQHRKPTPFAPDKKLRAQAGGDLEDRFFATVYVDDYLRVKEHHSDDDTTALTASASLASDHVRLFVRGEEGVAPILAPKKSTDLDTTIDALRFIINSHTMKTLFPSEKVDAIKRSLSEQWPVDRRQGKVRKVLSMAGKLWNLTYVVRADIYLLWRLLRLTGLHDSPSSETHSSR